VERLLEFCYTNRYTIPRDDSSHFLIHAQLYTLGDKYGIEALKSHAQNEFCWGLQRFESLIERPTADLSECAAPLNDILAAISHIYQNTQEDDEIRRILVSCPWNSVLLEEHKVEWASFLAHNHQYACDLTLYSAEKIAAHEKFSEDFVEYRCPECSATCVMGGGVNLKHDKRFACPSCSAISTSWTSEWSAGQPESRSGEWHNAMGW